MANIIAVIWDFDKTLVNGYMQDPIFRKYGVDSGGFWKEVNALPQKYMDEQGVQVNPDTIYLNQFIRYTREGKFKELNNAALREYGKELCFYDGIPDIFQKTQKLISENARYKDYDIKVEHYIISTGMTEVIKGSSVNPFVEAIWGCEFIEDIDSDGKHVISEIGYTIDNTSKTRALFEINKGVRQRNGVEVNTKISEELRRVHFKNMIYIADGPSDIPAFSVVNKNGGATFAVYPKADRKALRQVEKMRMDGRINMYAEADYSEGTTAFLWLTNKIEEFADRIRKTEKLKVSNSISDTPKHLL
ncbi:MAG: HAD family hydrolase [Clostridium sp.]|uniref:haloacid dehalogenase-like hydrolase n=1 Tax=Clostridium sp. TaxID=1506 RepID=UPI0039E9A361